MNIWNILPHTLAWNIPEKWAKKESKKHELDK